MVKRLLPSAQGRRCANLNGQVGKQYMKHLPEVVTYMHVVTIISLVAVGCGRIRKMVKAISDLAVFALKQTRRCAKEFREVLDALRCRPKKAHRGPRIRGRRPSQSRSRRGTAADQNGCSRRDDTRGDAQL